MKTLTQLLALAAMAAASTTAVAGDRVSDAQYMAAARCAGIARAAATDTASLDAYLKKHKAGRESYVLDSAKDARRSVEADYRAASAGEQKRMLAQFACAKFDTKLAALAS